MTKLIEKSEEGKLRWSRVGNVYRAQTPDDTLLVSLNIGTNPLLRTRWSEFIVKINGEEIIRVSNEGNAFALLAGISSTPLVSAIDDLVSYLESSRRVEIKRALGILDRL